MVITYTKDELERSLNCIERTHLLFEKHSSLLAFLRKRTRKNKHSLGYYKRTDACLERDYKECERLAIRLSNGYLNNQTDSWLSNGTSLETRKTFRFLLSCYEEASKCTQLNNNARVKTESLLYRIPESSKGPAAYFERLSDIIISFINGQEKYDYEPFRLDLCCPWKICGNFYTSIAILLLLNIIPRCDGRLRSSQERLNTDTEKFLSFIQTLEDKFKKNFSLLFFTSIRDTKKLRYDKHWCRFLMIVQLTKIIDEIFYYVNPNFTIALDERRELIRLPFKNSIEDSFWKDENDEGYKEFERYKEFYYIEQFPKDLEKIRREGLDFIIPYTMFLYKVSKNKNEVERFGLQLFDTGELAYRSIEYDSKILHNQSDDDTEMIGSYTISKDTFDFIVYGNEKNDTKRLKLRKLTEDERLRLACDELVYERIKMYPEKYIKGFDRLIQPIATKVAAFFMANTIRLEGNNKKIWYVEFNPQVREAKAIFDSISLANVDIVSDNDYTYLRIAYSDSNIYLINITLKTFESSWKKYGIRISEKSL